MSAPDVAVSVQTMAGPSLGDSGHIALIADQDALDQDALETIAWVLGQRELAFSAYRDIDALLAEMETSAQGPSLIVLWIEDTASSLLGCVERVTQRLAQTPIVVVCPSIERWEVRTALAAGVMGIVLSDELGSTLRPCLQAAYAGQICVPREHWRQVAPSALSTRERQILGLVAMGYMNSQIAEQLFLAESTVKSHLSSAFAKLGVRSRNEAVNLILDPERGLGMGILTLKEQQLKSSAAVAR
jgi:DNA-binding NarL/FixJ family response regulator